MKKGGFFFFLFFLTFTCSALEHGGEEEQTFKDHPVQLLNHFLANQIVKAYWGGHCPMFLEHWQAWGINHFIKKPVPVFYFHTEDFFFPNF